MWVPVSTSFTAILKMKLSQCNAIGLYNASPIPWCTPAVHHGVGDCPFKKTFTFNPLEIMSYKCSQVSMSELWVVAFVWRSSPLSFFVITLWGQALKQQQPNLGIHQAKLNQGLKDMMNTLIHRWKGSMNALSVFWGCESQCRQAVVTGSVEAVLYGPYGKVYQSLTNISWTP